MSFHPTLCKLGLGQMRIHFGQSDSNLVGARQMIAGAARQGCGIIVLHECLDLGWSFAGAGRAAETIPGRFSDELCQAAETEAIYVVAGLTEKEGSRLYNSAILISPEGRILAKHRKINLLAGVEAIYSPGDQISAVETPWGAVGINVCAYNFPESHAIGERIARMGASLLLSPCAWAVDADHDNSCDPYGKLWRDSYRTLANLYDMAVVGVSGVGRVTSGPWSGRKCIGCSLVVGPGGGILLEGPYGEDAECLLVTEVPLRPTSATGAETLALS